MHKNVQYFMVGEKTFKNYFNVISTPQLAQLKYIYIFFTLMLIHAPV